MNLESPTPDLNSAAWAYQRAKNGKDEWLTPPELINALGQFDLDPCAPIVRPWPTARHHFSVIDNGLTKPWTGRVWCNPPYDRRMISAWVRRCADHRNATLLTFARTDTAFFRIIFERAILIAFIYGRIRFRHVSGRPGTWTGGAGSALAAFDEPNAQAIRDAHAAGKLKARLITP